MQPTQYGWNQPYPYPQQPPTNQKPPWKHPLVIGSSIALVLVLCIGSALIFAAYTGALQRILYSIEPSCTIGFTGSAALMTIIAWSATDDCNAFFAGEPTFLGPGVTNPTKNYYRFTGDLTEPEVCELDIQGRHIVVRDEGALKLVGNQLCANLQQLSSS